MPGLPRPLSEDRPVYVYRLEISYPEGSDAPGWLPPRWDQYVRKLPLRTRRKVRRTGFRWPRERMFLSSSGAYGRAAQLIRFGCDVEIIRSDAVSFPAPLWEDTDGMRDFGDLPPGYGNVAAARSDAVFFIIDAKSPGAFPGWQEQETIR